MMHQRWGGGTGGGERTQQDLKAGVQVYLTLGPNQWGQDLISQGALLS